MKHIDVRISYEGEKIDAHDVIQALNEDYMTFDVVKVTPIKRVKRCKWNHDDDMGTDDTACGQCNYFAEGNAKDNSFKFCPYCGGKIVVKQAK